MVGSYSSFTASGGTTGTWDISGIDWSSGDVGFFWWYARNSSKTTPGVPSTLTEKFVQTVSGGSTNGRLYLAYRYLGSSDPDSFVWTSNSFASAVAYGVDVFRGISGADPFAVVSSARSPVNDNTPASPTLTPTANNQLVYILMGMNSECPSIVAPSGYSIGGSQSLSNASGGALGAASAYRILSGGSGVLQTPGDWATGAAAFVDGSTRSLASTPGVYISIDQGSYSLVGSDVSFSIGNLATIVGSGGGYTDPRPTFYRQGQEETYRKILELERQGRLKDDELAVLLIGLLSYDDDLA